MNEEYKCVRYVLMPLSSSYICFSMLLFLGFFLRLFYCSLGETHYSHVEYIQRIYNVLGRAEVFGSVLLIIIRERKLVSSKREIHRCVWSCNLRTNANVCLCLFSDPTTVTLLLCLCLCSVLLLSPLCSQSIYIYSN